MIPPPEPTEDDRQLQEAAHALIPGGCHTYAKGDDQYPSNAPAFLVRGAGCHVWDRSRRRYIEYASGLRSVTLGHGFEPVVRAAAAQMALGTNFNRPHPIEVEAAQDLLALLPAAEMVKFAKDGSTVVSAAVKLARAHTGRVKVAICAEHPFFAYNDWFMVTTGIPAGIPPQRSSETLLFRYNDLASAERLFAEHPGEIACVVLEAARTEEPQPGFLQGLRQLAHAHGALLVLDEMITGFRWDLGGAQKLYGIEPDLATFGKALGNGFAVSALVGKRRYMDLGGIRHAAERVFLLSTTHGAETHALAAARAVIATYRERDVVGRLYRQGQRLRLGIGQAIDAAGVAGRFKLAGRDCALLYSTLDSEGRPSQTLRTLFLQETLRRGVLAPSFMVGYSHSDEDIDRTVDAVAAALKVYRKALDGSAETLLEGPAVKPVYRRYN